jgi:hypothetical protein
VTDAKFIVFAGNRIPIASPQAVILQRELYGIQSGLTLNVTKKTENEIHTGIKPPSSSLQKAISSPRSLSHLTFISV